MLSPPNSTLQREYRKKHEGTEKGASGTEIEVKRWGKTGLAHIQHLQLTFVHFANTTC